MRQHTSVIGVAFSVIKLCSLTVFFLIFAPVRTHTDGTPTPYDGGSATTYHNIKHKQHDMETIKDRSFGGERPLFEIHNVRLENVTITDGLMTRCFFALESSSAIW